MYLGQLFLPRTMITTPQVRYCNEWGHLRYYLYNILYILGKSKHWPETPKAGHSAEKNLHEREFFFFFVYSSQRTLSISRKGEQRTQEFFILVTLARRENLWTRELLRQRCLIKPPYYVIAQSLRRSGGCSPEYPSLPDNIFWPTF